jgi:hypothetical protein
MLEVLIATTVLFIAASGVLSLFCVALMQNAVQGDHGSRVTEYAQDKMEQLMGLGFTDTTSDTTQYPTCLAQFQTCTGTGLTAGGGVTPSSPITGYVDYIDQNGNPSASSTNAQYIREWQIVNTISGQIKTITVFVQKKAESSHQVLPSTTLVSQKGTM